MFDGIKLASSMLDVGAGDFRIMRKLRQAGYQGDYHSQDIGDEYEYTYRDLSEIQRTYGAILCLNIIEHMALHEGLALINRLLELLDVAGVLVLQTPNARCVRSPFSSDMTHVHSYNLSDLWAYLTGAGLSVRGYRVVLTSPRRNIAALLRLSVAAFITTRFLGCDYADDILIVATKT